MCEDLLTHCTTLHGCLKASKHAQAVFFRGHFYCPQSGRFLKIDEGTHPVLVGAPTCKTTCAHASQLTPRAPPAFALLLMDSSLLTIKSCERRRRNLSKELSLSRALGSHLLVHLSRIHTLKRATGGWLWRQWLTPLQDDVVGQRLCILKRNPERASDLFEGELQQKKE